MTITVKSTAFVSNEPIPKKHTADGADLSPPLTWSGHPHGVKEFALICDDPDAPTPEPWVHWVLYKIPADTASLPENIEKKETPSTPPGAQQGQNSFHKIGYGGPAPPKGHGVHHYHFKLYALDTPIEISGPTDKKRLLNAIKGHILAEGELVGTYERK
jgi:hypothetical protein